MNDPSDLTPLGQALIIAAAMLVLAGTIRWAQLRITRRAQAQARAERRARRSIEHVVVLADERQACRDRHPAGRR